MTTSELIASLVCNPFGGLGLTGGMVDAGGLADCLAGIFHGKADDSILEKYDTIRRAKYTDIIDPVSTNNFKIVFDQDPDKAHETVELFKLCRKLSGDREKSREFQLGANAIRYDFTQHYNSAASRPGRADKDVESIAEALHTNSGVEVSVSD